MSESTPTPWTIIREGLQAVQYRDMAHVLDKRLLVFEGTTGELATAIETWLAKNGYTIKKVK